MIQYVFEFIGTLVLVLLGDGVCAATSLNKSKAKGGGWAYSWVPVAGSAAGAALAAGLYLHVF